MPFRVFGTKRVEERGEKREKWLEYTKILHYGHLTLLLFSQIISLHPNTESIFIQYSNFSFSPLKYFSITSMNDWLHSAYLVHFGWLLSESLVIYASFLEHARWDMSQYNDIDFLMNPFLMNIQWHWLKCYFRNLQ